MQSHPRHFFFTVFLIAFFCSTTHSFAYTDGTLKSSTKIYSGTTGINSGYGWSSAGIGDLDADGTPDIAIGRTGDSSGTGIGGVYLHFMNSNGTVRSAVHLTNGTTNGASLSNGDAYGYSVANIGDLNNDGIDDIGVGSYGNDMGGAVNTNRGAIFIHYMNRDGSILSTVKIGQGTTNGPTLIANDRYGASITGLGDLDNDGIPDIAVGAVNDDTGGADRGSFYIHYMNRNGSIKSTVKITSATTNGPTLANSELYGIVANIGDLDNDGIQDVAVGTRLATGAGGLYIHYMNRNGSIKSTVKITSATTNGPTANAGYAISIGSNTGDLDADGIPDLIVGAWLDDTGGADRGSFYIHYMNRNGSIKSTVKIASDTTNGPTLSNTTYYGTGASLAGDINGDGSEDIVVGVPYEAPTVTGAAWVHFMTPVPGVVVYDLDTNTNASTIEVTEGEVGDTLTVRLGSEPTGDVTVTPSIDGGQATLSQSTLTFTPSNWDEAQSLIVTATDDMSRESTTNHTLSFSATSSDTNYNNISIANVTVNVVDNDAPAINNIPTSLELTEGENDTFDMTLNSQPTNSVTVNIAANNAQASVDHSSITFTTSNWSTPQSVTVTAVNDDVDESATSTNITFTTSSSDLEYNNLSVDPVVVSVADNDTSGISVSDSSFTLIEGESDSFIVSLTSEPTSDVTLNISLDTNNVTLSDTTLVFTSTDWDTPQTITISTPENQTKDTTKTDTITFDITSSDGIYAALTPDEIDISVIDDETASVLISEDDLSITEAGTDTFTVRLSSEPSTTVTINLARTTEEVSIDKTTLVFTTADWSTPQTITVTATKDSLVEQNQQDAIVFTASSADATYNAISITNLPIEITDQTSRSGSSSSGTGFYVKPIVVQAPSTPITTPSIQPTQFFTKQLQLGIQDEEVLRLQKFLNERGFIISLSGPGSPGNETQKFGSLTKKAVQSFQKTYHITPTTGTFGPKSIATANILLKK